MEFFRPALSCVAHYILFSAINKAMPPGISYEQYIWAAFTVWLTFNQTYHVVEISHASKPPTLPGVTAMHMRLAHCAWHIFSKVAFCYISVAIMIAFGDRIRFPDLPLTLGITVLAGLLGLGLGLCVEGICRLFPILEMVFHILTYVLFISAGIYFSTATEPPLITSVFLYSPILHLVEYERYAFYPGYPIGFVNLTYPAACAAVLLLTGLLLNRRLRHLRTI